MKRKAFTMMELIFVIVILGILAGVAVPRLGATRDDAAITKGIADIAAIRNSISLLRSENLLTGNNAFPATIDNGAGNLFAPVLDYPISETGRYWARVNQTTFTFTVAGVATTFTYNPADGRFTCVAGAGNCDILTR
ncbi:MAG: type II secretion system protein [Campylobacteraceae bacterium]